MNAQAGEIRDRRALHTTRDPVDSIATLGTTSRVAFGSARACQRRAGIDPPEPLQRIVNLGVHHRSPWKTE